MRILTTCLGPFLLAVVLAASPACSGKGDATPAPAPTVKRTATKRIDAAPKGIPPKAKAVMEARWGGKKLDDDVHAAAVKAAAERGAADAMFVCADSKVASEIHKLKGVTVGRSSLRLRNQKNVGPQWVRDFLEKEGEKAEVDLKSITEIVTTDDGDVAHFLRRIEVQEGCLGCHGAKASLDPAVVALLAEKYPQDAAVGYSAGELRGVVWAEMPVVPAPSAEPQDAGDAPAAPTK